MAGHCQDCTGCCQVFEVKDIGKAFGETCKHLTKTPLGRGCGIYDLRPQACKNYVCLWLDSQRKPGFEMGEHLRPDVCKVVLGWPWGLDRETLFVYPYPDFPDHWKKSPVREYLQMVLSRGGKVVVVVGETRIAIKGNVAFLGSEKEFAEILA